MKPGKKILSFFLSLAMAVTMIPAFGIVAHAGDGGEVADFDTLKSMLESDTNYEITLTNDIIITEPIYVNGNSNSINMNGHELRVSAPVGFVLNSTEYNSYVGLSIKGKEGVNATGDGVVLFQVGGALDENATAELKLVDGYCSVSGDNSRIIEIEGDDSETAYKYISLDNVELSAGNGNAILDNGYGINHAMVVMREAGIVNNSSAAAVEIASGAETILKSRCHIYNGGSGDALRLYDENNSSLESGLAFSNGEQAPVGSSGGTDLYIGTIGPNKLVQTGGVYDFGGVTVDVNDPALGSASSLNGDTALVGRPVYITATPAANGNFLYWEMPGANYSTEQVEAYKMPDSPMAVFTAYFELNSDLANYEAKMAANATYTGGAIKPAVTIEGLTQGVDYKVTYTNNVRIGTATVKIEPAEASAYTGSITKTFNINPKGTSIKKPAKGKGSVTAKWAKQAAKMPTARVNGYQVQVATDSNFKTGVKTVTVKKYTKKTKKISKLKRNTNYYVHVRTYMTVGGKNYYSNWSAVKVVKTK